MLAFDVRYEKSTPIWRLVELHCLSWCPLAIGLNFSSEMLTKLAPDGINFSVSTGFESLHQTKKCDLAGSYKLSVPEA